MELPSLNESSFSETFLQQCNVVRGRCHSEVVHRPTDQAEEDRLLAALCLIKTQQRGLAAQFYQPPSLLLKLPSEKAAVETFQNTFYARGNKSALSHQNPGAYRVN